MSNMNMALWAHVISLAVFIAGIINFVYLARKRRFNQRIALLTLLLIIAIIPLNLYPTEHAQAIPFAFIPRTLQAFSVDVDYTEAFNPDHFSTVAPLESEEASNQATGRTVEADSGERKIPIALVVFFMFYKAIIYSAAPILGGVVIYDAFVGVSPHVRLYFVKKRRLYVFSELNLRSMCLAESIYRDKKQGRRPVLIFAHDGGWASDNVKSDLMAKAKKIHAICLPERLSSEYGLRFSRESAIFLMTCCDDGTFDEKENLDALQAILNENEPIWPIKRGCNIFCFTNHSEIVENIRAVKHEFDQKRRQDDWGEVVLHVVRDYAQTASTLMERHPLYEVLVGKEPDAPLKTLIIGNNDFSREMFKTVFWCGQLLDHPLELAVAYVAEQPCGEKTAFEQWLDMEYPELAASCIAGNECLRSTVEGDFNAPYATLCFVEVPPRLLHGDLLMEELPAFRGGAPGKIDLSQYDYIIVMTGDDKRNIAMMEGLWRLLSYRKIEGSAIGRKTIAIAIEDSQLSHVTRLRYQALKTELDVANIVTFGGVDSRFKWENIFNKGVYTHNREVLHAVSDAMHSLPGFNASKDDIYNEWSSEARQVHLRYKAFSVLGQAMAVSGDSGDVLRNKLDYCECVRHDSVLYERLSWLEHRRWNAFLRAQGFRRPPHLEQRLTDLVQGLCEDADGDALRPYAYKNVPARLHPDLVESVSGVRAEPGDLLDLASDMRRLVDVKAGKKPDAHDIKYYDRPDGKYGPILDRAEVCACLLDSDPSIGASALASAWSEALKRYPQIEDCADARYPGRYFAEAILALKERAAAHATGRGESDDAES